MPSWRARVTGKGVKGKLAGRIALLGNKRLMDDNGIATEILAQATESARAEGQTAMFVAVDGRLAGFVAVADPIKDSTPEALRTLQADGIHIVMLTGDSKTTAQAVSTRKRLALPRTR